MIRASSPLGGTRPVETNWVQMHGASAVRKALRRFRSDQLGSQLWTDRNFEVKYVTWSLSDMIRPRTLDSAVALGSSNPQYQQSSLQKSAQVLNQAGRWSSGRRK
jgi:hypothetical protein